MSKLTGTYKYDPTTKEMVKVCDDIPTLRGSTWFPSASNHSGYYSESCNTVFRSKQHKRKFLKEKGWAEL